MHRNKVENLILCGAFDSLHEHRRGLFYGLAAYGAWGVFPIYLKTVRTVPVFEVLCHRIVGTCAPPVD